MYYTIMYRLHMNNSIYNGYGDEDDGFFMTKNYKNLFFLAQELQKRDYDYERMYTKEELSKCMIPHVKMRRNNVPESRISFLEYKMRRNYGFFLAIFSDYYRRKTPGPMIELPSIVYPIVQHSNPNMKRDLYIYEREILQEYNNEIVVLDKKYNMAKDMDATMTSLGPLVQNASLEFVILTLCILASRLEYALRLEYNPDNTIKRIFFTNYGNDLT